MQYFRGTITPEQTGIYTIETGFRPKEIEITISSNPGNESVAHYTTGTCDENLNMKYHTIYVDSQTRRTVNGQDKIVSHYKHNGTSVVEVCAASVILIEDDYFELDVSKADWSYQYDIKARG